MRGKDNRKEFKELLVILALGVPGLGLAFGGFKACQLAGHVTALGAVLVAAGGCLVLASGYFHYRRDYSGAGGKRRIAAFLALTAFSAAAGVLATRLLFRR